MRNKLISSLAGAAFSFGASGLALAADMAVKAPPPAPAPVYNWTGWYAGVNVGASFGNVKTDFNAPVTLAASGVSTGPATGSSTFGFAGSDRTYPNGFIGGGQIGYNWQFSPIWVVGLEADFQGALERDSSTLTNNFSGTVFIPSPVALPIGASGSTVLDYQTKIDWFGTVRARIGYVWGNGNVLTYVTGGLAYGEVKINGTSTVNAALSLGGQPIGGIPPSFSAAQAFSNSHVNTGWVIGYGTEGRLATPGWTWKIEGLYMDLGHLDASGPGASSFIIFPGQGPFGVTGAQVTTHSHFTDGILRAGLNYQFH
jgi:outer membrane immunogenic protein